MVLEALQGTLAAAADPSNAIFARKEVQNVYGLI